MTRGIPAFFAPNPLAWWGSHAPFGIEAARRAGMRAVAVCTSHAADELAGPHVVAQVRDYHELMATNFLENLHAA